MQLYLQSAVVERGIRPDELPQERAEVVVGSVFANLVAIFIIIATGATLYVHGDHTVFERGRGREGARAVRRPLRRDPLRRRPARREPARRRDPAGHRRLRGRRDVRLREGHQPPPERGARLRRVVTTLIAIGTAVALIPGVPVIGLLVFVQVINGVLLPVTLYFVWKLSSNRELMGEYANGPVFAFVAAATVLVTSALSISLLVVTLTGNA